MRAVAGDRPLVVGLVGLLLLTSVMISGPLQRYLDGSDRVGVLEQKLDALREENARLVQRKSDLQAPDKVELMAREQLGFIRPGEVPYAIIPPEDPRPQITRPADGDEVASTPWYQRAWDAVGDLLR